jgi:hypothetical protein
MRKRIPTALLIGALAAMMALGTTAGASEKVEVPEYFSFPDFGNELAVFVNISRDELCTDEVVAFENAIAAWLEGGMVDPFPDEPTFSDGRELVQLSSVLTKKGALVGQVNEQDLYIEVWSQDSPEDRPLVGPCTDTDDGGSLFATGRTSYHANDNDFFGSGTRGNSFGDRGKANLVDADGNEYNYSWRFHTNSKCYAPDDGPPACLSDVGTLTAK